MSELQIVRINKFDGFIDEAYAGFHQGYNLKLERKGYLECRGNQVKLIDNDFGGVIQGLHYWGYQPKSHFFIASNSKLYGLRFRTVFTWANFPAPVYSSDYTIQYEELETIVAASYYTTGKTQFVTTSYGANPIPCVAGCNGGGRGGTNEPFYITYNDSTGNYTKADIDNAGCAALSASFPGIDATGQSEACFCTEFKGQTIFAGWSAYGHLIAVSDLQDCTGTYVGYEIGIPGDRIFGFIRMNGRLYIIKEHSIYTTSGYESDLTTQYGCEQIAGGINIVAPYSIVETPKGGFYCGADGIYHFGGGQPQLITEQIAEFYQNNFLEVTNYNTASIWYDIVGCYNEYTNEVLFFSKKAASGTKYEVLALDLRYFPNKIVWNRYNSIEMTLGTVIGNYGMKKYLVTGGYNDGSNKYYVYIQDNGTGSIETYYDSGILDFDNPDMEKDLRVVDVEGYDTSTTILVKGRIDYNSALTTIKTLTTQSLPVKINLADNRYKEFQVQITGTKALKLKGVTYKFKNLGIAR